MFRYAQSGRKILQVGVEDSDEEFYNRETVYEVTKPNLPLITVDTKNGTIMAPTNVREAGAPVINVEVTATNTGSPPLSAKQNVTIFVRDISGTLSIVAVSNVMNGLLRSSKLGHGQAAFYNTFVIVDL